MKLLPSLSKKAMKPTVQLFLPLSCFLGLSTALLGNPTSQPNVSFTPVTSNTWHADWQGVAGRTYFFQWSLDLMQWHYAPLVEFGTDLKSFGIDTQGEEKFFIRLHYADDTTVTTLQQAKDANFDQDGIPNGFEVEQLGSNPFDKNSAGGESDADGMADGWELFHFGGLGIADPNASLQPDGLTNKEKAELGLNPNADYTAPSAG